MGVVLGLSAQSQTFGSFSFVGNGSFGRLNPFPYNGQSMHNITVSPFTRHGVIDYGWSNKYLSNNWPTGGTNTPNAFNTPAQLTGSIDPTKYLEFTISAQSGYSFSNPKVKFNISRWEEAPHTWVWRSSLDNFTSNIAIDSLGPQSASISYANGVIQLLDVTSTFYGLVFQLEASNISSITFRLYGYNAEVAIPPANGATGSAGFHSGISFNVSDTYTSGGWSLGTSPAAGDNVVIDDNISLSAGDALDFGNLTLKATRALNLTANASGYAQLKVRGALNNAGTITHSQHLSTTGHHGISSPMTSGFTTTSGTTSALYGYDASTGAWEMSPTTSTVGAGFFAPVQASGGFQSGAGAFSVTGTPNTSHTHSLGYAANTASGGSGSGWNLIGNPYTCGLDWTTVTKTNVNNAFYVWDASTGTYQYYSGSALTGTYLAASSILSGVIPPMQAFWVQATTSGASIVSTMATNGTVSSSPTFYKTAPDNLILYAEDLSDPSLSDATWIAHAAGYSADFEGDHDAWKRSNYGGQANIYSWYNGEKIAINATDLSSPTSIPIGVAAPEAGRKYRLVLEQLVHDHTYTVILEDKLLNSFTDITSDGYVFTYGAWQNEDPRFVVHINQSTVGLGETGAKEFKVYQRGDQLVIHSDDHRDRSFSLVGLDGRILFTGNLTAGMASMLAPQAGVYILQISGAYPKAQRVVIQ